MYENSLLAEVSAPIEKKNPKIIEEVFKDEDDFWDSEQHN
jgi:hypothetical protein